MFFDMRPAAAARDQERRIVIAIEQALSTAREDTEARELPMRGVSGDPPRRVRRWRPPGFPLSRE
jgi:hypothetical protein